ncbi:MAG: aminodeoxychorismate/anthranilate synthase component II [Thermoplasmata archaeon]
MKVLLVDHEDSFVHNVEQALASDGAEVRLLRATSHPREAMRFDPDAIVLSPGPGHPRDRRMTGLARALLRRWETERPFLGICLGHQLIADYYGAQVVRAESPVHGETSLVSHDGRGIFTGIPTPTQVARYHSLVVDPASVPPAMEVSARSDEGVVMALRFRGRAVESVQFHPESYLSPDGPTLLRNFLREARR